MNRREVRAIPHIGRDVQRKHAKFGTLDPSGYNRKARRAAGQRNQRPQLMAWPVVQDGVEHVLLMPLNRAVKRVSAGRTRG